MNINVHAMHHVGINRQTRDACLGVSGSWSVLVARQFSCLFDKFDVSRVAHTSIHHRCSYSRRNQEKNRTKT